MHQNRGRLAKFCFAYIQVSGKLIKNEMKKLLYLITIITLYSCNKKPESLSTEKVEVKKESKFACYKFPIDSNRIGLIARTY
jgi:hypothetical protein